MGIYIVVYGLFAMAVLSAVLHIAGTAIYFRVRKGLSGRTLGIMLLIVGFVLLFVSVKYILGSRIHILISAAAAVYDITLIRLYKCAPKVSDADLKAREAEILRNAVIILIVVLFAAAGASGLLYYGIKRSLSLLS